MLDLDMLEKKNHATADWLQERGYDLTSEGIRFIKRIYLSWTILAGITQTHPNRIEHQDLIEKCSTAGAHYHLTRGDDIVTALDWIITHERKGVSDLLKEAQKIKNSKIQHKETEEKAIEAYSRAYCNWTKPDFQLRIQYKEDPVSDKKIDIN